MRKLLYELLHNHSPFMQMVVVAIIIGVGDLLAVLGDIAWLIGDYHVHAEAHHIPVLVVLISAFVLMTASFFWVVNALLKYGQKHRKHQMRLSDLDLKSLSKDIYGSVE